MSTATQQNDNTFVVDFLTSTAAALIDQDVLVARESDNLRLVLSGIHSDAVAREKPILLEMAAQNAEFLDILYARYGARGLSQNLWRSSFRSRAADINASLSRWGIEILKRAELMFNQPLYINSQNRCERITLYSSVLIDFAAHLEQAGSDIEHCRKDLAALVSHDMAGRNPEDLRIDETVAKALDFVSVSEPTLLPARETKVLRVLSSSLLGVAEATEELASQIAHHLQNPVDYPIAVAVDQFKQHALSLNNHSFCREGSLTTWEVRRLAMNSALDSLRASVDHLATLSAIAMPKTKAERTPFADSLLRRVCFDLISAGTSAPNAWQASRALLDYLHEKRLDPKQLLIGEATKIHPALLPRSIEILHSLEDQGALMLGSSEQKGANLKRSRSLQGQFQSRLTAVLSLALVLVATALGGCGLKTKPQTNRSDFRPEIPFHPPNAKSSAPKQPNKSTLAPTTDAR